MGGKKKKKGRKWGDRKSAHFFKNQKNGESQQKKKGRKMGGIKKPPIFKKWGRENKKKMGKCLVVAKKYRFLFFKKKKKWGENGRKLKIPHFLKMGVKKKKDGGAHRFF